MPYSTPERDAMICRLAKIDREYGAAFFILTAPLFEGRNVWRYVREDTDGIDFEDLVNEGSMSGGELIAVKVAWHLFNGHGRIDLRDIIDRLDDGVYDRVINAIHIRAARLLWHPTPDTVWAAKPTLAPAPRIDFEALAQEAIRRRGGKW